MEPIARALSFLACAVLPGAGAACSVTPLVAETATPAEMGYGVARAEQLGSASLIVGAAAHSGSREARVGDTVWRIRVAGLELCEGTSDRCAPVDTDGVAADTILFAEDVAPDAVFRSSQRVDDRVVDVRATEPTDRSRPKPANAIWVRGLPGTVFTASRGALAYCSAAEGPARCRAASFPVENGFVKAVLSTHRLHGAEPRDTVWLVLGDSVSTFWWGAAATEARIVRCAANPNHPDPRCELAAQ